MTNIQNLNHLQGVLSSLKERFELEATFNEERLNDLQRIAKSRHSTTEDFFFQGVRILVTTLQDKFSQGWTYSDNEASAIAFPNSPNVVVKLTKPDDVLDTEYAQIEIATKELYLLDIDALKSKLITEIAGVNLQIKEVQKAVAADAKKESAELKEIERVRAELLGDIDTSVPTTERQTNNKE